MPHGHAIRMGGEDPTECKRRFSLGHSDENEERKSMHEDFFSLASPRPVFAVAWSWRQPACYVDGDSTMVVLLAMAAAHSLASPAAPAAPAVVDDPLAERPRGRGSRRDRLLREGRGGGMGRRRQGLAAMSSAVLEQTKVMPSEEQVDGATTLEQLRGQEAAILETRQRHEEALARLQARYQKVRQKMYRDHKKDVISQDNAKLAKFQGGCAKPKRLAGLSKAEADEQARCLQTP